MLKQFESIMARFLGVPYQAGCCDERTLFRFDAFDCVTFVSTVLALLCVDDESSLEAEIKKINYKNGEVSFESRLHIMSADWNNENIRNDVIAPITETLGVQHRTACTQINYPGWWQHNNLEVSGAIKENVQLPYLPLTELLTHWGGFAKALPDVALVEIVRPNWQLAKKIGTNLNVSHCGFLYKRGSVLRFVHASSEKKTVVDVDAREAFTAMQALPQLQGVAVFSLAGSRARVH